jgi:hypothetical protein
LVLAMMLQRWQVRLTNAGEVEPLALITMRPKPNLLATISLHSRAPAMAASAPSPPVC